MNHKKKTKITVYTVLVGLILFVMCLSILYMFLWGIGTSLKERRDYRNNVLGLPEKYMFENYKQVFKEFTVSRTINGKRVSYNFFQMFFNTLLYAGGSAACQVLTCCIVAYLTAKYAFKFSKFLHGLVVALLVIPIVGATPSSMQLMEKLGLMDTVYGLWIRNITFTGTSYLIFYAGFKMLPWAYAEAGFMDGASHMTVMFRIMLPMMLNTVGVMFLITFVSLWNDYQTPMIYWKDYPTIAVGLFGFMLDPTHSSVPLKIACCMVTVFPILFLFIVMQKKMMGNLTIGGLKG